MAILLADIGGTHARFSWLKSGKIGKVEKFNCDDFKTPFDLIDFVLNESVEKISGMFFSVAGPVKKGFVQWTNRLNWSLSEDELKKRYKIKKAKLFNDMMAQGYGLKIKNQKALLMNVGTGLGACIILDGSVYPCEFGLTLDEKNQKKEYYLSGQGVVRLYQKLSLDKTIKSAKLLDEIRPKNKKASLAYTEFYKLWGKTAANISVAHLLDRVYLWGGLAPKNEKDKKDFLSEFYNKKYPLYHQKTLVKIVREKNLALKGLAFLSNHKCVAP